jgi:aconitate hydratase
MFMPGENAESLGLDGAEIYFISGIGDIQPRQQLEVRAVNSDNKEIKFKVTARLDTDIEVDYYRGGGILPYVLRKIIEAQ